MRRILILFSVTLLTISCKEKVLYVSSSDNQERLTIMTNGEESFVIEGWVKKIPKEGFVKVDIRKVTEMSDAIYICWPTKNKVGEIVIPNAVVVDDNMDQTRYEFANELPKDEHGIPRPTKFSDRNCTSIDFLLKKPYPKGSSTVQEYFPTN